MAMIKKIGIITYHHPHLKTEQILIHFIHRKLPVYRIYALPFVPREVRPVIFNHRPDQSNAISPEEIAYGNNIDYLVCDSDISIDNDCDVYIVGGSGLLSAECVCSKKIINCHPGVIPAVRGLDSFKWSIYNNIYLGCTLHYISSDIDAGEIFSTRKTPVYRTDSLETLSRRHYENEISMLSYFDHFLQNPQFDFHNPSQNEPTRRMPLSIEQQMCDRFHAYREKYGNPARQHGRVCECGERLDARGTCPLCSAEHPLDVNGE